MSKENANLEALLQDAGAVLTSPQLREEALNYLVSPQGQSLQNDALSVAADHISTAAKYSQYVPSFTIDQDQISSKLDGLDNICGSQMKGTIDDVLNGVQSVSHNKQTGEYSVDLTQSHDIKVNKTFGSFMGVSGSVNDIDVSKDVNFKVKDDNGALDLTNISGIKVSGSLDICGDHLLSGSGTVDSIEIAKNSKGKPELSAEVDVLGTHHKVSLSVNSLDLTRGANGKLKLDSKVSGC